MSDAARARREDDLPDETIELGPNGELRLSDRLRSALGWTEHEALRARVAEDGSLRIDSVVEGIRRARGMLRGASAGRSLVQELVDERKREPGATR